MDRINKFKSVLWVILGIGAAVGITRFIFGLGVTTNLTDNTPWGFWIGFDVMGGVALAAGGFVIAALSYIFGGKTFKKVSRAAILTAFLGYIAVAVGLLFDLGLPWNIWHMVIFWNPHSPLFEVGWCVMLYLTVLTLEFSPVVLEKYPQINWLKKLHDFLYRIRIPLVILGIMLSTLHQSSLGSLFLAMPYRLHPLWYSPIIPIIFFISAICLGLMMVMVESMTSSWLYKKEFESDVLKKLSKYAMWMLVIYALVRFGDIIIRGASPFLFTGEWGSILFWMEIAISVIIPFIIFAIPGNRRRINVLYIAALIGVVGIVFNRLNVGGLTHLNNLTQIGDFYFPSWTELAVSAAIVSGAMLVFFWFIENFRVWDEPPRNPDEDPHAKPELKGGVYLGPPKTANRTRFSFMFVLAFAIGFAVISGDEITSAGIEDETTRKARGGDTLFIDGNRDDYGVVFKHEFHNMALGRSCVSCHHMNKPEDKNTGCYECHANMYSSFNVFRHDWHSSEEGAGLNCFSCHEQGEYKSGANAKDCDACHDDLIPDGAPIDIKGYEADPYVDAMHIMCIGCHEQKQNENPILMESKRDLTLCSTCHPPGSEKMAEKRLFEVPENKRWVVVPGNIRKK